MTTTLDYDFVEENGKKFYIANQRLLITYKTHVDKTEIENFFRSKATVTEIHTCHENGDERSPYPHSHVLVCFDKRFQSRNPRIFDWNNIHPHIQKVKYKSHLINCYKYLAKEDPTCKYLLEKVPERFDIHQIIEKPTVLEAMELAQKPSDAWAISNLHKRHHQPDLQDSWDDSGEDITELWPWQKEIVAIITTKPKRRGVVRVVFDPIGDNGKNTLARYLESGDPTHIALIQGVGSSRDVVESIIKKRNKGWTGRTLFINVCRGGTIDYDTLEQLSDGVLTRLKYDGGDVRYKAYHVIILINYLPRINRLSKGRWKIHVIRGQKDKGILEDITTWAESTRNEGPIHPP